MTIKVISGALEVLNSYSHTNKKRNRVYKKICKLLDEETINWKQINDLKFEEEYLFTMLLKDFEKIKQILSEAGYKKTPEYHRQGINMLKTYIINK